MSLQNKYTYLVCLATLTLTGARAAETDSVFHKQFRQEIGGWIAADATYSIFLPDGRTLWLFGDTFIGEVDENNAILPGSRLIRNSAVIQDGEQLETLFTGSRTNPSDFIPTEHPDSTWYWPDHGVVDNDTLSIFLAKFREANNGTPGFNFEHAGNDIANLTWPGLELINVLPIRSHALNGVLYGDRILEDAGYLYVYGRKTDDSGLNIPYPHVARAKKGELIRQEWEYYTGQGWSTDPSETGRMHDFQVSQQYSVSTYRGKYILLTQDIWLSPRIYSFTSDSPVGPWGSKRLLYTTPETAQDMFTYNAYAHPQFDRDAQLLVSYNTNGDFWSIFQNVEIYRPRFIRVPYMNMDYEFWPNGQGAAWQEDPNVPRIFPNPVKNRATLTLDPGIPAPVSVEIVDVHGRVVQTLSNQVWTVDTPAITLDMSLCPPGIYLCKVLADKKLHVITLMKIAD
jgi:hypothetical protein